MMMRLAPCARSLTLTSSLLLAACATYPPVRVEAPVDYGRPLPVGADALIRLGPDERAPDMRSTWFEREEIVPALERSLSFTRSKHAAQFFPIAGVTHARAIASLERFGELLDECRSADEFARRFRTEFDVYKSAGWNGSGGGVLFTAYCTPLLPGSLRRTAEYSHPLHALPPDLVKSDNGTILGQETPSGIRPYPTRDAILRDAAYEPLEIVWLKDPLDSYIAHVNGSAFVELSNGEIARFGYAGKNGRPYTSLGKALISAGEIPAEEMSLAAIRRWGRQNPARVEGFLAKNQSYVFFTPIEGNPRGSLNVEVTAMRSLATDKSLFPRGALCFVDAELPTPAGPSAPYRQLMLDQDTGGAIRTAGRADIYLGVGPRAERLSGATRSSGQLYYFFLSE